MREIEPITVTSPQIKPKVSFVISICHPFIVVLTNTYRFCDDINALVKRITGDLKS